MSNIPEDDLRAIEAVMNEEFNAGVSSPEAVTVVEAPVVDTPDLTVDDTTGRLRGPDGKFVAKSSVLEEVQDGEEEPSESQVLSEDPENAEGDGLEANADSQEEEDAYVLELEDPELLELIENKYGGDVGKALASLKDAQSLIGRQGNELGELRQLQEKFEELQNFLFMQSQAGSVDWDEAIAEDPEAALRLAAQYQNQDAFESSLEAWAQIEPMKAFLFLQEMSRQQEAPPTTSLEAEMEGLKAKHPDLLNRLPAIQEEARQRPALAALLQNQDPRVRAEALEGLYHLASSRETSSATSKAAKTIILKAKAEADAAKQDASVVSASNSSAAVVAPTNANDALQQALREMSGLDDLVIV